MPLPSWPALPPRLGWKERPIAIKTPLLHLSKADIIRGTALGVDYAQSVSCYQADDEGAPAGAAIPAACAVRVF